MFVLSSFGWSLFSVIQSFISDIYAGLESVYGVVVNVLDYMIRAVECPRQRIGADRNGWIGSVKEVVRTAERGLDLLHRSDTLSRKAPQILTLTLGQRTLPNVPEMCQNGKTKAHLFG